MERTLIFGTVRACVRADAADMPVEGYVDPSAGGVIANARTQRADEVMGTQKKTHLGEPGQGLPTLSSLFFVF